MKECDNMDIYITINEDKEPYIKDITDDKIINLTGESGSGKSYYADQYLNDDNYIVIDTDIVFSDEPSDNKESVELRKVFEGVPKDYTITNFDDFYIKLLEYFKDSDKTIVIDSAQYRNIKDYSLLKGKIIVVRTCINTCYKRCIERWKSINKGYAEEKLEKYSNRKLGMYEWYKGINRFLEEVDKIRRDDYGQKSI